MGTFFFTRLIKVRKSYKGFNLRTPILSCACLYAFKFYSENIGSRHEITGRRTLQNLALTPVGYECFTLHRMIRGWAVVLSNLKFESRAQASILVHPFGLIRIDAPMTAELNIELIVASKCRS